MGKTCYGCIHKDTCALLASFNRDTDHICVDYEEVRYQNSATSSMNKEYQEAKIDKIKNKVFDENMNVISDKDVETKVFDEKKILTLIREKKVDMNLIADNSLALPGYNCLVHWGNRELTQEEFNLLREWNNYYERERSRMYRANS